MRSTIPGLLLSLFLAGGSYIAASQTIDQPLTAHTFHAILDELDSPFAMTPEHRQAARMLHALGTNALPLLMAEVQTLGKIEATNIAGGVDLKMKLQAAFEVLGPKAKPLLPELISEFNAGQSLGITPFALAQIGGDRAGHALIHAMDNTNEQIRVSGVVAIQYFKHNPGIVKMAIPHLLQLLGDGSGVIRPTVADTLGLLRVEPSIVIPGLLKTAKNDSDPVVRAVAIKSIGRFGRDAICAKGSLKKIAETDKDAFVRKTAAQVAGSLK